MNPLIPGFTFIFIAAVAGGAFAVPLRLRRKYEWENSWFLGFLFALIIIPTVALEMFLPVWLSAVLAAGPATVFIAMAFGFLWGWGAVTFAMGITAIGLSLGYATIMGISTALGSFIPMMRRWGETPGSARAVISLGILICVVGVAVCGRAGMLREQGVAGTNPSPSKMIATKAFVIGLSWCVLSGFLSACANLGFEYADRIADAASRMGANPIAASLGRWVPVYWGGFLAILIGTGSKMLIRGSWRNYFSKGTGRDFGLAIVTGILCFFAQIPYGIGAHYLGGLGTSVGWAVNIAFSLVVANVFGFVTGEWKSAPQASVRWLFIGLSVVILAVIALACGNSIVGLK